MVPRTSLSVEAIVASSAKTETIFIALRNTHLVMYISKEHTLNNIVQEYVDFLILFILK